MHGVMWEELYTDTMDTNLFIWCIFSSFNKNMFYCELKDEKTGKTANVLSYLPYVCF